MLSCILFIGSRIDFRSADMRVACMEKGGLGGGAQYWDPWDSFPRHPRCRWLRSRRTAMMTWREHIVWMWEHIQWEWKHILCMCEHILYMCVGACHVWMRHQRCRWLRASIFVYSFIECVLIKSSAIFSCWVSLMIWWEHILWMNKHFDECGNTVCAGRNTFYESVLGRITYEWVPMAA